MYEVEKGVSFRKSVQDLKATLKPGEYRIMEFNKILLTVSQDSNEDDICIIYELKHQINRLKEGYKD